nr:hypothetical protein [Tanacetum cinerariifolium]
MAQNIDFSDSDQIQTPYALNTKLLSINSQRLDKEKQEVKNVVEQPAERGNRIESLQNFRVIHKSSISFRNTSKISSIHAIAPFLSTKEPEYASSMGYEYVSITPETESDKVTESNAKNLVPIPSECEVTLEDKREYDDDNSVYDDDFEDIEYVEALLPDLEIVSEEENVVHQAENDVNQEEEEVDLEDISQIQDIILREKILSIIHLIANIEPLNENPTPDRVLKSFASDNSLLDNFSPKFKTFCDHTEETKSGNTTHADNSIPEYESFCFEIEPDQERLINISDDLSNNPLLEEADLFLASDNSIPSGIENVANDSKGDIFSLPPPEPPDEEFDFGIDFGDEILVVRNTIVEFECIDARVVFNDENDDYSYFMFAKDLPPVIEVFLCWIFVPVSKIFTSFDLKLVWGSPYLLIYIA